jgi:hypothetical protein
MWEQRFRKAFPLPNPGLLRITPNLPLLKYPDKVRCLGQIPLLPAHWLHNSMCLFHRDDNELLLHSVKLYTYQIKLLGMNGGQWEPLGNPIGTLEYEGSLSRWIYLGCAGKVTPRHKKQETCQDHESERSMDNE